MKLSILSLAVLLGVTAQAESFSDLQPTPAYQLPMATQALLTDVIQVTPQLYVAVGARGHVLTSTDAKQWQQAQVPVQSLLTSVYFADELTGFAVGHDATIIATTDGGKNWNLQHFQPETDKPLFDILFKTPTHGIALGAYGMFYRTTDAGKTWVAEFHESLVSEEDLEFLLELKETDPEGYENEKTSILPHFNRVFLQGNTLYLVGEAGFFATSTDFGKTWVRPEAFYNGSLFGVTKTAKGSVIAVGLRGHAFRSQDEGKTWSAIDLPSEATLNSAFSDDSGLVYFTGNAGTLLVSKDDGQTFTELQTSDSKAILNALVTHNTLVQATEAGIRTTQLQ